MKRVDINAPFRKQGSLAATQGKSIADCPYKMSQALTRADLAAIMKARPAWIEGFQSADRAVPQRESK